MNNQSPQAPRRGFAGVYLSLGGRTRFWGWGTPPAARAERPRAGMPDLRSASSRAEIPSAGRDTGKPTVRFACDRHFIGLVVR